jgi:hypothetical protein
MMGYWALAAMSADAVLASRVTACAAQQGIPDPLRWVGEKMPEISAAPGWAEAWTSAVEHGNANPGKDRAVITDEAILTAIRAIRGHMCGGTHTWR